MSRVLTTEETMKRFLLIRMLASLFAMNMMACENLAGNGPVCYRFRYISCQPESR